MKKEKNWRKNLLKRVGTAYLFQKCQCMRQKTKTFKSITISFHSIPIRISKLKKMWKSTVEMFRLNKLVQRKNKLKSHKGKIASRKLFHIRSLSTLTRNHKFSQFLNKNPFNALSFHSLPVLRPHFLNNSDKKSANLPLLQPLIFKSRILYPWNKDLIMSSSSVRNTSQKTDIQIMRDPRSRKSSKNISNFMALNFSPSQTWARECSMTASLLVPTLLLSKMSETQVCWSPSCLHSFNKKLGSERTKKYSWQSSKG